MSGVRLKPGPYLSPIECAKRGDPVPLAARIESRSASAEECKAAADIIKDRFRLRESPERYEDRFKIVWQAIGEYETLKERVLAADYNARKQNKRGKSRKCKLWADVQGELGRRRTKILTAARKYRTDPECQKGILTTPWDSLFFSPVLTCL